MTNAQGQWVIRTPYGTFSVAATDQMVTTFKPAFLPDGVGAMQMLTPLGDSNGLLFSYTNISYKNGQVARMATMTRGASETYSCELDGSNSNNQPPSSTAIAKAELVSQGYLDGNPYTRYAVNLRNTGNVRLSCRVIFDYEYAKFPGVEADRRTLSAGPIAVGATQQVVLSLGDRNFTLKNMSWSCERWPFD